MDNAYTVLIVDDTPGNIEILSDMLKNSYNIVTAESGQEALELLRASGRIDVVLLDLIMPGTDGYEVLRQISSDDNLRAVPVIVITSDSDREAQSRSFELGAVDFVPRGADIDSLKHRIKSVLRLCELDKIRLENERLKNEVQSERHLSALMDNLPGGVAVIKTDGESACCAYYNDELLRLFRMSAEDFALQFSSGNQPDWIRSFMIEARNSSRFSYIFGLGDTASNPAECQWIRLIASGLGNAGDDGIYCVFLDINSEKRQELRAKETGKQLRDNKLQLETLLNNAPGGIACAERGDDGRLHAIYTNCGLAEMFGYPNYETCFYEINQNPSAGVSPPDVEIMKEKIEQALKSGKHMKHSFKCRAYDGKELWVIIRGHLTYSDEGRLRLYAFITNISKEKAIEHDLRVAAYFDPLTGLYNRSAFMKNAQRVLDENPLLEYSLMKLNIGGFKIVNDLLGWDIGDKVLIAIADALREAVAGNGVYARFFADNFVILTPYSERGIHPRTILEAVRRAVKKTEAVSHDIQYYIGVYKITDRSLSVENMSDRAAIACRSIKGSFREHIAYYDEKMRLQMLEEQEICDESHRALTNGEFCVYYQPVYGIKAKRFVSAEALVRWNHPTKGMISPGKFIPVFEKNGFIAELDLYVLEQVCKYQKKRKDLGLPPFPISVNISRMSLYNPNLFEAISGITERYEVSPEYFRIEITESAYNDNPAQLLETVGKLREKCYPVLMDDFGSGYSSLNTLKDIPIDILKLDMKFMQGFEKNGRVGTIVTSVARMSKWLNVPMLAEGVETKEQYEFLASIGCAYIQGYYFSRPVSEEEFTRVIAQENVVPDVCAVETYEMSEEVNEMLGSNALLSKLISGVFGGLGIYELVDDRLEVIRVNDGYMQIMGYTPEDFSEDQINIWNHLHPEDVDISRNACLEAQRTDKAVRATVRRYNRNGKLLYLDGVHRRLGGTDENPIFCITFNDITDKIESGVLMERSLNQIDELLKATGSAVADIDFTTGKSFFAGDLEIYPTNPEYVDLYSNKGNPFMDVAHPDDLGRLNKFISERRRERDFVEFRILHEDGVYRWWRLTETRTFDENGKLTRLIGVANNIDAERHAEAELKEQRRLIDLAMDNFGSGILMLEAFNDHSAHIIYSNDSFWKILGKENTGDEDLLDNLARGVAPEEHRRIVEESRSSDHVHVRYSCTRSDGKNVWIDLTSALSKSGGDKRVYVVVVSDITEQYVNRLNLEAIVRNFDGGVALLNIGAGGTAVTYANEKFYDILNVRQDNTMRLNSIFDALVKNHTEMGDIRIKSGDGVHRIVRIHLNKIGSPGADISSFIAVVNDVTLKRSEAKSRIAERMANASAGLYDDVFEINYRTKTTKLMSSRRYPERAAASRVLSLDYVLNEWTEKFIHPDDVAAARAMFSAPMHNPDFTDSYCEIRMLDVNGDEEYHTFGMVLVRSKADSCMLFSKDKARVDNSLTSAQVAETNRLYKLVAEQTHTTVIEFDHVNDRIVCSPSIELYWASKLSEKELSSPEEFRKGLAVYHEDQKKYTDFLDSLYDSDKPASTTIRLKMADESYKWCRISVSLTRGKNGKVLKSLCTINLVHNDVIARMKAQQSDELLRRTVRHIPVGVGIFRLDGEELVPIYLSDNIYRMYRIKNGKFGAASNLAEAFVKSNELVPGAEGEYTLKSVRADGTDFWLSTQYRVISENGDVLIYAALSDISDRIASQRREAVQEQMYQVLLEETGTVIFNYNPEADTFTYLNHSDICGSRIISVEGVTADPEKLALIKDDDRVNFIFLLKKLSVTAGAEEILIKVDVDGYPRRHKAFVKSVCDGNGKVFEIIGKIEDVDDEMARLESIRAKAMYDSLCINIFNKATTEELIKAELERSTGGALLMIDVDDFKSINDTLGHMFGDEFLKKFASTVKGIFRDTDIVGRYGGDEFFVFMPHATASLAEKKGNQILEKVLEIEVPMPDGVKSSIGISSVNPDNRNYRQLLKQADSALYQAKNRGKNCVVVFDQCSMSEGAYRTEEAVKNGRSAVVLSSNPSSAASTIMRVFSALYTSPNISEGINQMLELVGKTYDVSRVYIFEDTDDGLYCCNTFEWCGEGINSEMASLQKVSYEEDLGGNYRENMNDDGIFYCHDITELSDVQREILERQNIKSVLQCAIMDDGQFKGFVGFDECRSNRFWTQEQIDSLVFISKVLSIFLLKARTRTQSENYANSLKSILDNYPQYLYIVDHETRKLLYLNNMTVKAVGEGRLGTQCSQSVCGDQMFKDCPIRALEKSGKSRPIEMISPVLKKKIRAQATEVQWEGRKAYLVSCEALEE